jgi:pimeloyl-ACP methyl ester carboxylesterase
MAITSSSISRPPTFPTPAFTTMMSGNVRYAIHCGKGLETMTNRSLAVFVHGIESNSEACWGDLLGLMKKDPAITSAFDLLPFDYSSRVESTLFHPLRKLPEYGVIAKEFEGFLQLNFTPAYDELYLCGHSQGGLIIQDWLIRRLNDGEGRKLRVREILLFSTPTLGSDFGGSLRHLVFGLMPNPQEEKLRPFDSNVADTRRAIEMRVIGASACDDRNCPIPIVSFWGETDGIVRSASAEASFEKFVVLPGDHSTILHPPSKGKSKGHDSQVYKELTGALLKPEGHRHIYEIDSYETAVAVSPLTGDQQAFVAKRRGIASTEHSDNFAQITRKVCFSSKNHCVDLFRFNYQTNERGYLLANVDMQPREFGEAVPPNMALKDEVGDFSERGTETTYKFEPQPGRCHSQTLRIWNGFNAGGRDVHFHTGSNFRCGQYRFVIDLTAYVAAGWKISEPQLFISPWDTGEHSIGEQRLPENRVLGTGQSQAGTWTWSIPNFRGGVVDAVWDVSKQ